MPIVPSKTLRKHFSSFSCYSSCQCCHRVNGTLPIVVINDSDVRFCYCLLLLIPPFVHNLLIDHQQHTLSRLASSSAHCQRQQCPSLVWYRWPKQRAGEEKRTRLRCFGEMSKYLFPVSFHSSQCHLLDKQENDRIY